MTRPSVTAIAMFRKNRMKVRTAIGPELRQPVELGDARRERGEDERDHDEEQHPQENLPDRIEHQRRELARRLEQRRVGLADQQRDAAGGGADQESPQDAVGEAGSDI